MNPVRVVVYPEQHHDYLHPESLVFPLICPCCAQASDDNTFIIVGGNWRRRRDWSVQYSIPSCLQCVSHINAARLSSQWFTFAIVTFVVSVFILALIDWQDWLGLVIASLCVLAGV